jgi:hypothetical protein
MEKWITRIVEKLKNNRKPMKKSTATFVPSSKSHFSMLLLVSCMHTIIIHGQTGGVTFNRLRITPFLEMLVTLGIRSNKSNNNSQGEYL